MSGQWEIVSKGKQKQNGSVAKKLTKNEKQRVIERAPKVEEILPLSQVKSLFTALDRDDKENKKPGNKENVKENDAKKVQKKRQEKKKELLKEKPAIPKTIEAAAKLIILKEIISELEVGQRKFPDTPLVWLKGLVGYLNTKLTVESINPVFSGKPYDYPLSGLSSDLKDTIKKALKDGGESTLQPLFEWCLTAMANDMSRADKASNAVLGYKVVLQLMALQLPSICSTAVGKVNSLLGSYHNRQAIGLSLLWAVGMGGYRDLVVGFRVWQEVMAPLLELRNYSAHVVGYLRALLAHKHSQRTLKPDHLCPTLDFVSNPPSSLPASLRQELQTTAPLLVCRVVETVPEKAAQAVFPPLLHRLKPCPSETLKKELLASLVVVLQKDPKAFAGWQDNYKCALPQSGMLLAYIEQNWAQLAKSLPQQELQSTLQAFVAAKRELTKADPKQEGLAECSRLVAELLRAKMTSARTFPWRWANLMMLVAIAVLLAYDVGKHSTFRRSSTGRLMRDVGALPHLESAWGTAQNLSSQAHWWLRERAPVHYHALHKQAQPYMQVAREKAGAWGSTALQFGRDNVPQLTAWVSMKLARTCEQVRELVREQGPPLLAWLETNVPVMVDQAQHMAHSALEWAWQGGQQGIAWLKVASHEWCPEGVEQCAHAVLNSTQLWAQRTYSWLSHRLQTIPAGV